MAVATENYKEEAAPCYAIPKSRDEVKAEFQRFLETGRKAPAVKVKPRIEEVRRLTPRGKKSQAQVLYDQIVQEIEDRTAFLDEMRVNGASEEYEPIILGEIAERMRELKKLEKMGLEDEEAPKPRKTMVSFDDEASEVQGEEGGRVKGKRKNIPKGRDRHNRSHLQSVWAATHEANQVLDQTEDPNVRPKRVPTQMLLGSPVAQTKQSSPVDDNAAEIAKLEAVLRDQNAKLAELQGAMK